jgi:hypothetical protein
MEWYLKVKTCSREDGHTEGDGDGDGDGVVRTDRLTVEPREVYGCNCGQSTNCRRIRSSNYVRGQKRQAAQHGWGSRLWTESAGAVFNGQVSGCNGGGKTPDKWLGM